MNPKHAAALQLLEHPEQYPGLPPLDHPRRIFRVWEYPAFSPYRSWSLLTTKSENEILIRRVTFTDPNLSLEIGDPETFGAQTNCPRELFDELCARLQRLSLGILLPDLSIVLDGTRSGIELGDVNFSARIEWKTLPPSWNSIQDWHAWAIESMDALFPSRA